MCAEVDVESLNGPYRGEVLLTFFYIPNPKCKLFIKVNSINITVEIQDIVVEDRRRGIGRLLVQCAEDSLRDMNYNLVKGTVVPGLGITRDQLNQFWNECGYDIDGEDMTKFLNP